MNLYLLASYFSIFSEYLSILLFICLPVVLLSAILAIWLHYRQKRRKAAGEKSVDDKIGISFPVADNASHSMAVSPLATEDKIGLIRECRKQLRKSRAKFLALKSDFTGALKDIALTGNLLKSNEDDMENLDEKIAVYEKQITELQNKLEVLEAIVPVQDEDWHLRQALKEKDNEIEQLKATIDSLPADPLEPGPDAATGDQDNVPEQPGLFYKLEELKLENERMAKTISEQEKELMRNRQMLENIYKEQEISIVDKAGGAIADKAAVSFINKTGEIAKQSLL